MDKNLIPTEIQKDVKAYIRAKQKDRFFRAKAKAYNSKYPNRKPKSSVTKYAYEVNRLFWKITFDWLDHFFPKAGEKVFYFGADDRLKEATVISRGNGIVTLKALNGHIFERAVGELTYENDFSNTDVFESMRLA